MKPLRIILWIVGLTVLAVVAYVVYTIATTKQHSPFSEARYQQDGLDLTVTYCRPYKKGRLIFGPADAGALQPWGQYWRMGANEATEIQLNRTVRFGDDTLAAGRYVIYAVPGEQQWTIGINSETGRWGYNEVDHSMDLLQTEVTSTTQDPAVEQLTIDFSDADSLVYLNIRWDNTLVPVPIAPL
ncbi:MAG: hypothetical protein OHK0039_14040 [Bacteroidia bacterium]